MANFTRTWGDSVGSSESFGWIIFSNFSRINQDIVNSFDNSLRYVESERIVDDIKTTIENQVLYFSLVGHTDVKGYHFEYVQEPKYQEIEAGDTWTFYLEDYFSWAFGGVVRFHNIEGAELDLRISQVVQGEKSIVLVNETIIQHGYIEFELPLPRSGLIEWTGGRWLGKQLSEDTVSHLIEITNNEQVAVLATILISGWLTKPTELPVENTE